MMKRSRIAETETMLARQLGHLIRSGLSYDKAFQHLQESSKGAFRYELAALKTNLEGKLPPDGKSTLLHGPVATLAKLISIAKSAGSDAASILGNADEILGPLDENYRVYWAGITSFLWYVSALLLVMLIALVIFSIFVFPQFRELFDNSYGTLPKLTALVMNGLNTLRETFIALIFAIVISVVILAFNISTKIKSLEPLTGFVLKIPGLSSLGRNYNSLLLINLTRLLASSGIEQDTALRHVWSLQRCNEDFDTMISTSEPNLDALVKDDPVRGALIFSKLAGTLDAEIVHLSSRAETIFATQLAKVREEFTLIAQIAAGFTVAILVISMYLPIFKMGSVF